MHILKLTFLCLTIVGVWKPSRLLKTRSSKLLWNLYSSLTIGSYSFFAFNTFILMLCSKSVTELLDRMFLVPTTISCYQNIIIFAIQRERFMNLEKMFFKPLCLPLNVQEVEIQKKYENNMRFCVKIFLFLGATTTFCVSFLPAIANHKTYTPSIHFWLPFKINSANVYWTLLVYQHMCIIMSALIVIGTLTIIGEFTSHTCAQFDILSQRWSTLPIVVEKLRHLKKPRHVVQEYEKQVLKRNVMHHLYIYRLTNAINDSIRAIMFQQFFFSTIYLSASAYQLTSTIREADLHFVIALMYSISMLAESFFCFWFCNELYLKGINFATKIYKTDWTVYGMKTRTALPLVMQQSVRPTFIKCGYIFTVNLQAYLAILKLSYSVVNIILTIQKRQI